jgi:hypothetical protein
MKWLAEIIAGMNGMGGRRPPRVLEWPGRFDVGRRDAAATFLSRTYATLTSAGTRLIVVHETSNRCARDVVHALLQADE